MLSIREEVTRTLRRLTGRPSAMKSDRTVFRTGRQLDSYRILRPLGAGGMGQVYLALDTRLGRHVALKFLPPDLTSDAEMFQRLEQEAQTASGLNHPNIVTIYEVGEFAGDRYIVSEYIDGVTLQTALQRKAVDLSSAMDIAMQVASALVAAHAAGVTHRDIKPANIMIRPDGYVKVIDFGIAKLAQKQAKGSSSLTSGVGSIVGTVEYMSPEQARGDDIDPRTDLWSLGVILYEMLAGERPFTGKTESHIIVNILDNQPAAIHAGRPIPLSLLSIVDRALAKDRSERYQTASELLSNLHEAAKSSGVLTTPRRVSILQQAPPNQKRRAIAASVAGAIVGLSAVWWWGLDGKEVVMGPDWFVVESVRQMTFNGRIKMAAISPDGKYLAYVVGDPGGVVETLCLRQTDMPAEEIKIPAREISYEGITFSPDSLRIFEVEKDKSLVGKLYSVPIIGDRGAMPIVTDIDGPVSFSPSGEAFAFVRYVKNKSYVNIARSDGSSERELSSQPYPIFNKPAWSPKTNVIANLATSGRLTRKGGQLILHLVNLERRETSVDLPGWDVGAQPFWTSAGKTLITSAATNTEGNNQLQIRELAIRTGQVHDITKDLASYHWVTLTRDSKTMAAVKRESKGSIWVSTNDVSVGQSAPAELQQEPSLAWRDSSHIILNTERNGSPNLLLFDVNTKARNILTNEPHVEQHAVAVPGKRSVVFVSNRSGSTNIWKYDPETNSFTRLTFGTYDNMPSVTPDGKWVVYASWTTHNELYKVPLAGGIASRIGTLQADAPVVSPDGNSIACKFLDPRTKEWNVGIIPFSGEGPFRVVAKAQVPFQWSPDGVALTSALTDESGVSNIWSMPLDGGPARQLTKFDEEAIVAFNWSPDGARLACIRVSRGADVMLFTRQK